MGEVDARGEEVHVGALQAPPEEVACQQGTDHGLAGARVAMQGEDQRLGRRRVLHEGPKRLPNQRPDQGLAGQVLGQVTLQT